MLRNCLRPDLGGTFTAGGYGNNHQHRLSGSLNLPFENGHVTHLDLAAVHGSRGSNHHVAGHDFAGGGVFMSSSLSAAALNASSCAVPIMEGSQRSAAVPSGHPLVHSSSLGWGSNGSGRGIRYQQHQEECPHFNAFKEAPT